METVNIKINGRDYEVAKGITVLEAAKAAKIDIPTLCYLKDINEIGACRLCLVEIAEMRGPALGPWRMVTACVYPCTEGMEINVRCFCGFQNRGTLGNGILLAVNFYFNHIHLSTIPLS